MAAEHSGAGDGGGAAGTPAAPTCYRHPERETWIRCTRCERPICPDCMLPAPVGFHCPECVREGARTVRPTRTVLGAEVRRDATLVTKVLVGLQVACYLLLLLVGEPLQRAMVLTLTAFDGGTPIGVSEGQVWRLVTASFVHLGLLHLVFVCVATWFLGHLIEPDVGRWRFLAIYLLSAIAGNAASLLALPPLAVSFGASGAVFGLVGAGLAVSRRLGRDTATLVGFLVIGVVLGLVRHDADWPSSVVGFLVGAGLGAAFAYAPPARRVPVALAACAAALALSAAAVALAV